MKKEIAKEMAPIESEMTDEGLEVKLKI